MPASRVARRDTANCAGVRPARTHLCRSTVMAGSPLARRASPRRCKSSLATRARRAWEARLPALPQAHEAAGERTWITRLAIMSFTFAA